MGWCRYVIVARGANNYCDGDTTEIFLKALSSTGSTSRSFDIYSAQVPAGPLSIRA